MILKRFYEAGGEGEKTGGENQPEVLTPEMKQELADLREFKINAASQIAKTPEELKKEAEIDSANFRTYAIKEDLMKEDDFKTLDSLSAKEAKDLVYEGFSKDFKEDNPEIVDATELAEATKEAFETRYGLNSKNEKVKARGLSKISQEASLIKTPYENKFKTAKSKYDENNNTEKFIKEKAPSFNKFIDDVIAESAPDKLILFKTKEGEEEIAWDTEITKEQKEEISKMVRNHKNFNEFAKGDTKGLSELKAKITQKITGYIKSNNFDIATQKTYELGKGVATKAAKIGSSQPFALVKDATDKTDLQQQDAYKQVMESHKKASQQDA